MLANIVGKRKHPATAPIKIHRFGAEPQVEEVPTQDIPVTALLPIFTSPGIFLGSPKNELRDAQLRIYGNEPAIKRLWGLGGFGFTSLPVQPIEFARMIAKVAHAEAVRVLGLEAFEAYLTPMIRARVNEIYFYVGSVADARAGDTAAGTWVYTGVQQHGDSTLVVSRLGILSHLPDAPVYEAVVGKLTQAGLAKLPQT